MKICDAHVHLGKSGPWQPYINPTIYLDELIRLLDKYDVEQAIVFPNPNVGDKCPEMNDYIAECMKKYPKRLIGFGRVGPRREDAIKELSRIKKRLGLTGLKLHPMVEYFRPDHPFFNKFFQKTNELNLPILFHSHTLPEFIELSVDIDEDKMLFGSDVPYYRYPTQIVIVEVAEVSEKVKRKIFFENFQEYLAQME